MKLCPTCQNKYPDDANFCPREECAGEQGPRRLEPIVEEPAARFVPISRLGGGPSGEVWQANDAQTGSAVAYKVVVPEALPNATAMDRAQRELRQLQRAGSPRIVKVIEFGKTPEGRLFIASELASGEPLDQVVARSGPFPLDRAKRVAAQIGEALLEAQKVGVVHRDLAAKNILVSGDDEVRVINFAVARPLFDNLLGVPEYMSPEQSEGKLIDQRSNTYSLGALLYLMLTGHPPHAAATPRATIEEIQKGEITPPSIKRGGGLTAEVDRIVLKALERNSSRRPLTMRQFLTDVSGLIVTEQSSAGGAAGTAGRDAGFAKTMMFAGGASEVQKLVAQAIAARQAGGTGAGDASGAGAPAAPAAKAPTPAPLAAQPATPAAAVDPSSGSASGRPSHGAAVAATMIAVPVPGAAIPGSSAATPPPVGVGTPAVEPVAAKAGQTPPPAGAEGGNFRETLWFKKGDVDQMVAEARAKVAAMAAQKAGAKPATPGEGEIPTEDAKPLEDRYVDDGTVTVEDRKKFSLRSGATSVGMPARGGQVPGERMSENEMLGEIGGGKRFLIIGIVAAVVVALVAVVVVSMKGKGKGKEPGAGEAPAAEQVAPAAAPEKAVEEKRVPPAAEEKAAAAEKAPAEKAPAEEKAAPVEKDEKSEKAEAAAQPAKPEPPAKSSSTKKKSAAKKKASAAKKKK